MNSQRLIVAALTLMGALAVPHAARAAESYDNCSGFIDTLPTTISTQGVWCMRHDLATAVTDGAAITIATNNVTIDCNDFKIGGLAAGPTSIAIGIWAENRQNAIIRHCNVRGFSTGISLSGGTGNLVEDNRLDNNLYLGIGVFGDDNRVRRNTIYTTGGHLNKNVALGIYAYADITDNTVSGVFTAQTTYRAYGILAYGTGTRVEGNRVGGVALNGGGTAYAILAQGNHQTLAWNRVVAAITNADHAGIIGAGIYNSFCTGNTSAGYNTGANAIAHCQTPAYDDNMIH